MPAGLDDPSALAIVAVVAIALVVMATLRWLRRADTRRRQQRARRASAGEERAARMLSSAGYTVEARQARVAWTVLVDGEANQCQLRADYLVARAGRRYVAEVKTGHDGARLGHPGTRRQLLEYWHAFGVDGVLLVCPERDEIHEVEFPGATPLGEGDGLPEAVTTSRSAASWVLAMAAAAAIGYALLARQ